MHGKMTRNKVAAAANIPNGTIAPKPWNISNENALEMAMDSPLAMAFALTEEILRQTFIAKISNKTLKSDTYKSLDIYTIPIIINIQQS
jgi:hypothetical protein